jgi:nicotinamide-nucleotide amidase
VSELARELKALLLGPPPWSLAVAESLTCGRVQARVGEVSGASNFFRGGITAYSLEQKVRHLGVDRAAAKRVNSVSAAVAEQMARGVCTLFGSDVGVATTGYAEPSPGDGVEHPFAWWALAHRRDGGRGAKAFIAIRSGRVECPGANRIEAQAIVADAALTELAAYLRHLRG